MFVIHSESKKRAQLENIIPINKFMDQNTGQFNEQAFRSEIERKVKSNMSVEDIAESYCSNSRTNDNSNNNIKSKTASASMANGNSQTWFLDVFDLRNQQQQYAQNNRIIVVNH
ncbi:MAG: hypothetical protein WBL88_06950 [Nitrososphaeraceae archaeon]